VHCSRQTTATPSLHRPELRRSLASRAASPLRRCRHRSHSLSFCLGPRTLLLVLGPRCGAASLLMQRSLASLPPPVTLPEYLSRPPLCFLCGDGPPCAVAATAHTPSVSASAPAAAAQPRFLCGVPPAPLKALKLRNLKSTSNNSYISCHVIVIDIRPLCDMQC